MDVVWKTIPRYESYEASNTGQVRTLHRDGKILSTSSRESGHVYVRVTGPGKQQKIHIARLILAAFKGWPVEKLEACHGDSNPANNHIDNLRWDTRSGNHKDRIAAGTSIRGSNHFATKLTEQDVVTMRAMLGSGAKTCNVAKAFGIGESAVYCIKHRITWRHI